MHLSTRAKWIGAAVGFVVVDAPQWLDSVIDLAERPSTKPYMADLLSVVKSVPTVTGVSPVTWAWLFRAVGLLLIGFIAYQAWHDRSGGSVVTTKSTADVRFVLDPGMEAKLHVTNKGPAKQFFASLWFDGQGTGGHPPLFAHWGDATKRRISLAKGQTGVIVLGRMVQEENVRRWDLFGTLLTMCLSMSGR